ncbi:LysE family translocator [Entomohabitans teleogrylli]|uniref:LysE family translocator n=1 Tax=Entomohabitans teleogrylli TaxID=1384589 RepID=UPI00073DB2B4|nr:LysE family translocator [Entomohabitans teleogrylli]
MTLSFFITSLFIVLLPGVGVMYTLAMSVSAGLRAGILATVGCTLGTLPHLLAAVSGAALFLEDNPRFLVVMQYAGGVWLLYMAWQLWRDSSQLEFRDKENATGRQIIVLAILMNALNPKLTLFFFAFLPQFVAGERHVVAQMTMLGLVFVLMTFVVFLLYALFALALRQALSSRPAWYIWFRKGVAVLFVPIAVSMMLGISGF